MKKKYIVLIACITITLAGCSLYKEKDSNEILNKDSKQVINNSEKQVENVQELYPQSILYFEAINQFENIKDKEKNTTLLNNIQTYILENYPYDYSKAKDKAMLETVEDFGLMERLLITSNDHMFYEATNNKNTIGLNYYIKSENDVRNDNIIVITDDLNLQEKICKNKSSELKIHSIYERALINLKENISMDIDKILKELEYVSKEYDKKEMNDDIVACRFNNDKEYLIFTYSKTENKIVSLNYNNQESLVYESACIKDKNLEMKVIINKFDDLSEQKELFNEVLGKENLK